MKKTVLEIKILQGDKVIDVFDALEVNKESLTIIFTPDEKDDNYASLVFHSPNGNSVILKAYLKNNEDLQTDE